jgi:hypothetical protein
MSYMYPLIFTDIGDCKSEQKWPFKFHQETRTMGRGILLWMLGVPLPIILLLAMCSHH